MQRMNRQRMSQVIDLLLPTGAISHSHVVIAIPAGLARC